MVAVAERLRFDLLPPPVYLIVDACGLDDDWDHFAGSERVRLMVKHGEEVSEVLRVGSDRDDWMSV